MLVFTVQMRSHFWHGGLVLFVLQLIAHASIVPMVMYGSFKHYLLSFFVYFLTGCFGMSMSYHRLLSHKSWRAPLWFQVVGPLLATLGLTGSALAWIAIHREHHMKTDQQGDPHSPHVCSFFKVQFLSMFHQPRLFLARDLAKKSYLRFLHKKYLAINLSFGLVLYFIEPFAVVYLYLFPAAILWNAGSLINNLGHLWGYRNFHTNDNSKNNIFLGIFMWGEGWHNNHHRYPVSAKFGVKKTEIDIAWFFIRILKIQKKSRLTL
jgi:sn-2 palmitoyl-lipid 9-desaturase